MSIGIATAPVSWGIWEMTIDRPDLIPPETFLETIVDMGYTATETGPPGYFAPDGAAAVERARRYGVELIATFLPLRLDDPEGFEADLAALDQTVEVLEASGDGGIVLLADMETPERARANDDGRRAGMPRRSTARPSACSGPRRSSAAGASRSRSIRTPPRTSSRSRRSTRCSHAAISPSASTRATRSWAAATRWSSPGATRRGFGTCI
jgi:hypothetical protein